ncbi:rhomboid family intramembrane serine protease [Nocardioides sp.]|uniref:rhomboid family intramembrane serine protease n=1 Tax=Nocardioides sp. TaxID=35761 RepID=UPI003D1019E6
MAEGAKSTRAARTTYGGTRSENPQKTSLALIIINVGVWIAIMVTGGAGSRLVDLLALRPNGVCLTGQGAFDQPEASCVNPATWLPGVSDGAYWQMITSTFAHVEVVHIGFNMLALWVLGPTLEAYVGRVRFLALYLLSGLAGSVLVYWASYEYGSTLGASGSIFGLMGGLLVVTVKIRGNVQGILTWIAINAVITVVGAGSISWQGHLGGFLGGVLIAALLIYAPKPRRTTWQVSGMVAIGVVLVLATALRTTQLA